MKMSNLYLCIEVWFGIVSVGEPIVKFIEPGYDMNVKSIWIPCVILTVVFDLLRRRRIRKDFEEELNERNKYVVGSIGLK